MTTPTPSPSPSSSSERIVGIVEDGRRITWIPPTAEGEGGLFAGDRELVAQANVHVAIGAEHLIADRWVRASAETTLGAVATLLSLDPGIRLTASPADVLGAAATGSSSEG